MKKIKIILLMLTIIIATSCQRVAPNYAGVLMENYGKSGKSDYSLVSGRVSTAFSPGSELFQVPLFMQRAGWEDVSHLNASDNTAFTAKPQYSYTIIKERAVDVVFNNSNLEGEFMTSLEQKVLEPFIYDIMKEESRSYVTDTLMSVGGNLRFEKVVESIVRKKFLEQGIELKTFSANLQFSKKVTDKIDQRNEVNTNVTVLDQQIIEQRKKNELAALVADENVIRSRGITPQILQEWAIDKWNGVLPTTVTGNTSTVMNIPIK